MPKDNEMQYLCRWLEQQWTWHAGHDEHSEVCSQMFSVAAEYIETCQSTRTRLDRPCERRADIGADHGLVCEPLQLPGYSGYHNDNDDAK